MVGREYNPIELIKEIMDIEDNMEFIVELYDFYTKVHRAFTKCYFEEGQLHIEFDGLDALFMHKEFDENEITIKSDTLPSYFSASIPVRSYKLQSVKELFVKRLSVSSDLCFNFDERCTANTVGVPLCETDGVFFDIIHGY